MGALRRSQGDTAYHRVTGARGVAGDHGVTEYQNTDCCCSTTLFLFCYSTLISCPSSRLIGSIVTEISDTENMLLLIHQFTLEHQIDKCCKYCYFQSPTKKSQGYQKKRGNSSEIDWWKMWSVDNFLQKPHRQVSLILGGCDSWNGAICFWGPLHCGTQIEISSISWKSLA